MLRSPFHFPHCSPRPAGVGRDLPMTHPVPLTLDSLRARFLGATGPQGVAEGRGLGFFEAALDQLPLPAAVVREGIHLWANPAYAQLLDQGTPTAVTGRPLSAFLEPASCLAWEEAASPRRGSGERSLTARLLGSPEAPREVAFTLRTFHQGATDYFVVSGQDLQDTRKAEAAFKRNEHWWRHLFESSMAAVAVLSPDRRVLEANAALLELVGAEREEVVNQVWTTWLAASEEDRSKGPLPRASAIPQKAELTVTRRDGTAVPIRVGSHPIYAPDGSIQCYLALVQDLTELHAHKAREALLLQAIEQSSASVVITDARGAIEYVNQAFTRATGFAREEALGHNPRILKSGVHTPEFYAELWGTLNTGRSWSGRMCNRRKDGSRYWEQCTISPVFEGEALSHFLAVKEDISDRLALEVSHQRLASAIGQTREGVFLATGRGRVIYTNEALARLLGAAGPLAPGTDLIALLPREQRRELVQAMHRSLATGRAWEGRIRIQEGGNPRVLGGTLTLAQDIDGLGACVVGVFQDLTRELEAERNLVQVEKMNSLGALAGGVVHDLNNVLTAILSASELLEWTLPEDAQAHAKLQVIRQAVLRAKDINRRIQTFSRQEQETFIPFDLSALVKEVCVLLKTTLPPHIHFSPSVLPSLWTTGNPAQLHQVLMNLAVNSYQAMEGREGSLEIQLAEVEPTSEDGAPQLRLTVVDDGPGIPPEVLARVFEPYFTTKSHSGGTGLGLSVVQKILTAHGGSIQLESRPGQGTRATIHLDMARPMAAPAPIQAIHDLEGIESVLLVGEDEVQLALMKQGLSRLGYQVGTFADGMLALEAVRRNPAAFDVVVAEPEPRGLSGAALLPLLRALRPDLALIHIGDMGMTQDSGMGPALADAYLTRPVGLQDLARAVRDVAPRLRGHADPTSTGTADRGRTLKVLLAEDSASTRALLRNWLVRLGCEVLEARDGEMAWEIFAQNPVDFVFTDIVMPRMDGLQLTERIRLANPEIPVAVLTSLEDHASAKSALNLRVDEFLNKPFSQEQLVQCVERLAGKLQSRRRTQESHATAQEVRKAQQALVATPEADVPIFTVHQSLTDAGGDLFKWFRRPDGSIFFVLGDVMGHSVMSSYAVAAFLGMLSSLAPKATDLHDLMQRLNQGVKEGPFPDIPVCALLGHWDLRQGRVHLVNAGIPHGFLADRDQERALAIEINGTPLGFFDSPVVEEKVMWLREGDRLLFTTDGVLECTDAGGAPFEPKALPLWKGLGGTSILQALEIFCAAAQVHGSHGIQDDVMVVAFEQGPAEPRGVSQWIPSRMDAVDEVVVTLEGVLDHHDRSIPLTRSQRFNIVMAAREALINAVSHGNLERPGLRVFFQALWIPDPPRLRIVVADEGLGFEAPVDPVMPDPMSTRGRGLPFIYNYAATTSMVGGELTLIFAWEA